ncbi:MAG TPA: hypothetical protein VFK30_05305, partial [Anaerolineae bacterium]|nr:hypothetical protein [Anaerolineae bacterium]
MFMTAPTQAQIEAAARAIQKVGWPLDPFDEVNEAGRNEWRAIAVAALTAAAGIGRTGQEASDNATSSLDWTAPIQAQIVAAEMRAFGAS